MSKNIVFALFVATILGVSWCAEIQNGLNSDGQGKKWLWRKPKPSKPANSKFDVVFLLDSSNSVGKHSFEAAKRFAINLLNYFSVFPAKTRIAAATYNGNVSLQFDFKKYVNKECVEKRLRAIKFLNGFTHTGKALEYVRTDLINNINTGARADAEKVIFLFTTGRNSENSLNPLKPAFKLKQKGVKIFVIYLLGQSRFSAYRHRVHFRYRTGHRRQFYVLRKIASGSRYLLSGRSYNSFYRVRSLLRLARPKRCYSDKPVLDECGRRCKCVRGKLVDCCRLRKEFVDMTKEERTLYVQTVIKASTHPAYKERYERLLTIHRNIFFSRIHELDFFLPWHRWFILQYENLLREIDCRITVPFWDWSLVGAVPLSSDLWNPGPHGFGGDGKGPNFCVDTGPFREKVWALIESAGGGCLRRQFNFRTPDAVAVKQLIMSTPSPSDFERFELLLRFEFHDLVHCVIDGTMCTLDSASAPEFFLHHGFVDKIWWDWQRQSRNHTFNQFFLTQTQLMPSTVYRSKDFLDLNDQPGCVCAEYVPSRSKVYAALQKASREKLFSIKRLPMPPMPEKSKKLFKITEYEIERLQRLMEVLEPRVPITKSSLRGKDKVRGYNSTDLFN